MKKYPLLIAVLFTAVILLAGCTTGEFLQNTGISQVKPSQPDSIKIYSVRNIGREYIELGAISVVNTQTVLGDELKNFMRQEAAKQGADAVIAFKFYANGGGGVGASGICVKYK